MEVYNRPLLLQQLLHAHQISKLKNPYHPVGVACFTGIVNHIFITFQKNKKVTKIYKVQEILIRCFQWTVEKISILIVSPLGMVKDQIRIAIARLLCKNKCSKP